MGDKGDKGAEEAEGQRELRGLRERKVAEGARQFTVHNSLTTPHTLHPTPHSSRTTHSGI
ncbi:hypothetical protein [Chroococcidiopsis sp.]|uniref:hypothetical protein n=1 Tax=Chroococcidiopsis sp. TaxID=3088168 RepID=UPI003F3F88D9